MSDQAVALDNFQKPRPGLKPTIADLTQGITQLFKQESDREWRDRIEHVAQAKARDRGRR
jgi:hypothetical protein